MDHLGAIGVIAVQIAMISVTLGIGLAAPFIAYLFANLPRWGMGACH